MAAKTYLVRFGTDNPANRTGLTPTFTKFFNSAGAATTPPAISEIASSGLYAFSYEPMGFIGFIIDGTASLPATERFVTGVLDLNDRISEAAANVGTTVDSFGDSASDPTTMFGFMKRIQELLEGNSIYAKGTGLWSMYSRGSSYLLRDKTVADSATQVTKT